MRQQLFVLAYNLGNFLRRLALPTSVKYWTLTTLLLKQIKTGAKVVRHARCPGRINSGPDIAVKAERSKLSFDAH